MKILDVGCGATKISGSLGIDHLNLANVDIIHDLNSFPWPVESNQFDKIIFAHSISHLGDIGRIMEECNRILKIGGLIEIVAPHYSSDNFNTDPTHKIHLGSRSMNYYVNNVIFKYHYLKSEIKFDLEDVNLSFRECITSWRDEVKFNPYRLIGIECLVNKNKRIYEKFFCWIFPCSEVYYRLIKK